ncbi:hypothetical protein BMETH_146_0 [methanotrophic bacterial endosymbiont of Bathymodiolus sp.]|nr:hypothetical protein BMETH_146_0 [methanotrophic bacterial endosymbiont of Bathymodiolus sp.]
MAKETCSPLSNNTISQLSHKRLKRATQDAHPATPPTIKIRFLFCIDLNSVAV